MKVAVYPLVLFWLNLYVCRNWFSHPTAWMNSLHGFQAALIRAGVSWSPAWWPYWDFGIPFEFTSAPLVPALGASIAALRHTSPLMAYQAVSAIFYCAAPVALFLLAWTLTHNPHHGFFAGLFFSLLAPAQILAPEGTFAWSGIFDAHRFKLQAVWDETPHCAALTFLLLFIVMIARGKETRRPVYTPLAAISLALALLAWPFALIAAALSAVCLRLSFPRAIAIFAWALALAARFLPPSLWYAIGSASAAHEAWDPGVFKYWAALAVVWFTVEHRMERRGKDRRMAFAVFWTIAMSAAPLLQMWLHRTILPQAYRFRLEMEAAIALLVVFALSRLPRLAKATLAFAALVCAVPLTIHHRRLAKDFLYPADPANTVEYRIAQRIEHELPGVRVLLPGSIAHWANAWTGIQQFSGGEGTTAYSQAQQRALKDVFDGAPRTAIDRLEASGTAAVAVSSSESREFWKPFDNPAKFEGLLPVLWRDEGITLYRVPIDSALEWKDRNHLTFHGTAAADQAISVPVSYHPGWHATLDGRPVEIRRDNLGLMRLRPAQPGPAAIELHYDGGWELRLCGWLTTASTLAAAWFLVRGGFR